MFSPCKNRGRKLKCGCGGTADALVSGSSVERRVGSNPVIRTKESSLELSFLLLQPPYESHIGSCEGARDLKVPQSSRILVDCRALSPSPSPCFVDFVREKQLLTVFTLLTRHPHQREFVRTLFFAFTAPLRESYRLL